MIKDGCTMILEETIDITLHMNCKNEQRKSYLEWSWEALKGMLSPPTTSCTPAGRRKIILSITGDRPLVSLRGRIQEWMKKSG